jgi:predicted amidophosphoribosyltransferase
MQSLARLLAPLAPPRCAACRGDCGARRLLCGSCEARLRAIPVPAAAAVPGIDRPWAALPHDDAARALVVALKFGRLLAVADPIAALIAERAPPGLLVGELVPVPAAPARLRWRGFDPAERIAASLAERTGLPLRPCLARAGGPRQVGRSRAARLASPPRVHAVGTAPRQALLVDDVQTTGATLRACARALRSAGSKRVCAVTFARTL